jgi:hypothetical protein
VLTEGQIEPVSGTSGLTLTRPLTMAGERGALAAVADSYLGFRLNASGTNPVLAGHHVLADLAVLALDAPSVARGAVIHLSKDAPLSVEAAATLLEGLGEPNRLLEPVTVDHLFNEVEPLEESQAQLRPKAPTDLSPYRAEIARLRGVVASYQGMIGALNNRAQPFDELALSATAENLRPAVRRDLLQAAATRLDRATRTVELSGNRTITLTSRNGVLPITVHNRADFPVNVVLVVSSDRLEFPRGDTTRLTLTDELTRVDVPIRTRVSGSFPITVELRSPDRKLLLAEGKVVIRSTAVSGVGLVLSGGAMVFLAVWWGRHWRRTRRAQRLIDRPVQTS